MSKTKNRFVAGLLAFTLILTGMSGLNGIAMVNAATEDEATVTEVTCTPSNVSEKGGEIEVTVKGTNLSDTVYYGIWGVYSFSGKEFNSRVTKDAKTAKMTSKGDAWTFKVELPDAESAKSETFGAAIGFKIGVATQGGALANSKTRTDSDKIVIGNPGETKPAEVDKSALNSAIAAAEKLNKADYTTATWTPFAKALSEAKAVQAKAEATQEEVNSAKTALLTAKANLRGADVEAVCTGVTVNPTKVSRNGGEVEVSVAGTDLTEDAYYQVYYNYDFKPGIATDSAYGTKTAVKMTKSGDVWKFKTTIPAIDKVNASGNVNGFKVAVCVNGINSKATKSDLIKVAASSEGAEVTSIDATPKEISYKGGEVTLKVNGINLTEDNWGVQAKAYIVDTDMDKTLDFKVKNVTENSATLVVPMNTLTNDLECRIVAGVNDGEGIKEQAKTTFVIKGKPYRTDGTFGAESAELIGENQVRINFENELELYCAEDEAPEFFSVLDASKKKLDCKAKSVEIAGKSAIVTFESIIPKEAQSIGFDEGVFKLGEKNEKPLVNGTNSQILTKKESISSITFEKDVFSSKGGTVKATLDGFNVDKIALDSITANIFEAGKASKSDITVAKTTVDGKPVLTFDLPENKTKGTQCYILKAYQDGKEIITGASRESRNVLSVLPEGKTEKDQTLGMATIVAMRNTGNTDLQNAVAEVSKSIGELKTEVRLYGTNLDMKKTKLRAIDENGILWPVYDIPECDGMWRFVAIAGTNKNGVFGDGNAQLVELLPPRYAGTNKKFTIQVSIDGENWLDTNTVTLTVNNQGISSESDFRTCNKEDIQTITVKYVDEKGNEIAAADKHNGYGISMLKQFEITPKKIDGYTLIEEKNPNIPEWVYQGPKDNTYTYTYKADREPQDLKKAVVKGIGNKTYTGKAIKQKISVTLNGKTVASTNYSVTYKNNTKVGVATVVISGKGAYTGSVTKKFKINPKSVALSSVKAKKKAVKVTWKKSSMKVSGYQVSYSTSKHFKKAKTTSVKYTKSVKSKTVKKLKSKKKYYVRVRTYTKTSGGTCYSSWSKAKSAKVK